MSATADDGEVPGVAVAKARRRKRAAAPKRAARAPRKWSAAVTRNSDALDLERQVFAKATPEAIARSLKRSAERSRRRKASPYRSAMSMLTFYINRAGKNLPKRRRDLLERSKVALRKAFGRQ
ncbi:MAG TPA: DUF3175 domain-containing protein [Hyphomicrobiaceae bacterium]|nr:DUF3175 domain-containing protein [Hyphomicrobiaceae bacterium]